MKTVPPIVTVQLFDLEQLRWEVQRLLDDLDAAEAHGQHGKWLPCVDVCESDHEVIVRAEIPGVEPSTVEVAAVGTLLKLTGEKPPCEIKAKAFHCLERATGRFTRVVRISRPFDVGRSTASMHAGVLTVRLTKIQERRLRAIAIPITVEEE